MKIAGGRWLKSEAVSTSLYQYQNWWWKNLTFSETLRLQNWNVVGDVTIEGFKVTNAQDTIIGTDQDLNNVRLIDIAMYRNSVTGSDDSPNGLISVHSKTSMQILNSDFSWNKAIVVENRGNLMIHSSAFSNNRIKTPKVTVSRKCKTHLYSFQMKNTYLPFNQNFKF